MQDWLLQLISAVKSVKTALTLVLWPLLSLFLWPYAMNVAETNKIPGDVSRLAAILFSLGCSYLITCILAQLWTFSRRGLSSYNTCRKAKAERAEFKAHAVRVLAVLPKEQLATLKRLLAEDVELNYGEKGLLYLVDQKFVTKLHKVSSSNYIFRLNPLIKTAVSDRLAELRNSHLSSRLSNLSKEELHFLTLFFEDEVNEGTETSTVNMESATFRAGEELARASLLEKEPNGARGREPFHVFILPADAQRYLEEQVFNANAKRNRLELHAAHIWAVRSSGGGTGCGRQ